MTTLKKFRLQAKNLFLTYSQINTNITKEEILEQLNTKLKIKCYIVACELHKNSGTHFHVYLELERSHDIKSAKFLDIQVNGNNYHGNYQRVINKENTKRYLTKTNDFITNVKLYYDKNGKEIELQDFIVMKSFEIGIKEALKLYVNEDPICARKNIVKLNKALKTIHEVKKDSITVESFDLKDLNNIPPAVEDWIKNGRQPPLALVGEAGLGKTVLAKALVKDLNPLYVKNWEKLRDLSPEHKSIIFDDCSFAHLGEQERVNVLDTDVNSQQRILYGYVETKGHTIVLTANSLKQLFGRVCTKQELRRVKIVRVEQPIVINITNSYNFHSCIWNNAENIKSNEDECIHDGVQIK